MSSVRLSGNLRWIVLAAPVLFASGVCAQGSSGAQQDEAPPPTFMDLMIKNGEGIDKGVEEASKALSQGPAKMLGDAGLPRQTPGWTWSTTSAANKKIQSLIAAPPKSAGLIKQTFSRATGVRVVKGIDFGQDVWAIGKDTYTGYTKEGIKGALVSGGTSLVDVAANNAASEWGAVICARGMLCVAPRVLSPAGTAVVTVAAGLAGAVGGSATYQYLVKPTIKGVLAEQGKPRSRIVALTVSGPPSAEPGSVVEFRAFAEMDLTYVQVDPTGGVEGGAKVVTRRLAGVNVTTNLLWESLGAESLGYGRFRVACGVAGNSIVVTATDRVTGTQGMAALQVEKMSLTNLMLDVAERRVKPGAVVPLRVQAYEGRYTCTREAKVAPADLTWKVSRGGTVEGDVLRIDREAKSGPVTVSVQGPNNVVSNSVAVEVAAEPRLERIAVSVPPEVKPCDVVAPSAVGFYSDDPGTPRAVQGLRWSFAGRYTSRGSGAARVDWPDSVLKVTASAPSGSGEVTESVDVKVGALGRKVPWFPIENVTIVSRVTVGSGFVAKAIEFSCDEGARPARNVRWSSSAPGILACGATGECTGVAAGTAVVNLEYEGRIVTGQNVHVDPLPQQPATVAPTAGDSPAVKPVKTCTHWSDCPAGQVCENGQCVAKPEISVSCSPQVVKVGEPVSVSVGATYADRGYIDVTGTAKLSRSNPFVPTDAGTYVVSANYQGVIGRCAVKVEGDKPSPCPGDQVRAYDGSCVPVSSVDAVVGTYGQRQSDRDRERQQAGALLPGAGLGAIDWSGSGTRRPFGPDTLRDSINRNRTGLDTKGDRGEAGGGSSAGGTSGASTGSGGTGTASSGQVVDKPGAVPTTTPGTKPAAQSGWYLFEWVVHWSKADCADMLHVNYNRAYLAPAEVEEYRAYVLRSFPDVMPSGATYKSGTVRMLSGPSSTPPTVPTQKNECILDPRTVPQPQIFGR